MSDVVSKQDLRSISAVILEEEARVFRGGGTEAIERQHAKGRKTARERIEALLDEGSPRLELGIWAGYQLYEEWGGAPGAGVVTLIGSVHGRRVMVVANDATVKAVRVLPDDDQEDPARPGGRRPEPVAIGLSRRFLGRVLADAG